MRKKAALCLLRLLRKTPADAQLVGADGLAPVMAVLLEERDLGLLLCTTTLLLGVAARAGSAGAPLWHMRPRACAAVAAAALWILRGCLL